MKPIQYYVRIPAADEDRFLTYLDRNEINAVELSRGGPGDNILYSIRMQNDEASAMKISFGTTGFLNFNKAMGKMRAEQPVDLTGV